ncbi:MAG: hypothetical protein RLN86_04405 [Cyclobacteriaceae bacterium]
MQRLTKAKICCVLALVVAQSCATYYETNISFNEAFRKGNLELALEELQETPEKEYRKRQFLFLVNNGLLLSILGRYEESNTYLEKAFIFGEDFRINYLNEAASYLTNPNFTVYRGEDHEHLLLLYYKALNFLKLGKTQEALVECRRMNIRLQQLSDRYDTDKKYREDAFIQLLMGIIYETDKDYNNAFIAYRNAYNTYQSDYVNLFNMDSPEQLKVDLVRTALLSGLQSEYDFYKREFGLEDYAYEPSSGGDLVFFWHNGLGPVKAEWGINFVITRRGDMVTFYNESLGLSFPFNIGDYSEDEKKGLEKLEVFRVAFPKYVERPIYFTSAVLENGEEVRELEKIEDVNKIGFQVLEQRMTLEFSKALIRAAMKKVAEYQVRKENEALGSLFGIINAITEKADTRNWQTLPHSISYARVPLMLGNNDVTFTLKSSAQPNDRHEFAYVIDKPGVIFHTFTSLESRYEHYSLY